MPPQYYLKLVLIGDLCADKIMLLHEYTKLPVPCSYKPTVWPQFSSDISLRDDNTIEILSQPVAADGYSEPELPCHGTRHTQALWNTPFEPDELSSVLREHACEQASCIILCFSIQSIGSYGKAQYLYYDEIQRNPEMRKLPLLVVGTHSEFRNTTQQERQQLIDKIKRHSTDISGAQLHIIDDMSGSEHLVPYNDAKLWSQSIGAHYIETSHATEYNVKHVFHTALKLSINYHNRMNNLPDIPIDIASPPNQSTSTARSNVPVLKPASATALHKDNNINELSTVTKQLDNNTSSSMFVDNSNHSASHNTTTNNSYHTQSSSPAQYNHINGVNTHKQPQQYQPFTTQSVQIKPSSPQPARHSLQAHDDVKCCHIM